MLGKEQSYNRHKTFDFSLMQDCHALKSHTLSELHCGCCLILRLTNWGSPSQLSHLPLFNRISSALSPPSWAAHFLHYVVWAHRLRHRPTDWPLSRGHLCSLQCGSWYAKAVTMAKTAHNSETLHNTPHNQISSFLSWVMLFSPMFLIDVNKYSFLFAESCSSW